MITQKELEDLSFEQIIHINPNKEIYYECPDPYCLTDLAHIKLTDKIQIWIRDRKVIRAETSSLEGSIYVKSLKFQQYISDELGNFLNDRRVWDKVKDGITVFPIIGEF